MRSPDQKLQVESSARGIEPARRRNPGEDRGEDDVSPVPSDATGVRSGDWRGREDATRPRRRYITY
jgi:hypothetical protein